MAKLIIIRGNSGSGKSTIAKAVRKRSNSIKVALIEQDYLRRTVLQDRDEPDADNIDLIFQTATFALDRGYDVILEGILVFGRVGSVRRGSRVIYKDGNAVARSSESNVLRPQL